MSTVKIKSIDPLYSKSVVKEIASFCASFTHLISAILPVYNHLIRMFFVG